MSDSQRLSSVQRLMDLFGYSEEVATAHWYSYLFYGDRKDLLQKWATQLRLFRYVRAAGGHANDADELVVAYRYSDFSEAEAFLNSIGIHVVRFEKEPPQMIPGVGYSGADLDKFPSLVPGTSWVQQPGHCVVQGQRTFVYGYKDRITFSVGYRNWEVLEEHFQSAEVLEKILEPCPLERLDPPRDYDHCFCPKYYPEFFRAER